MVHLSQLMNQDRCFLVHGSPCFIHTSLFLIWCPFSVPGMHPVWDAPIHLIITSFVLVAAPGLCWGTRALCCSVSFSRVATRGFSLRRLLLWGSTGSGVCRYSPVRIWVQLLRSIWNILRSGIEPLSLTLVGGFLTSGPPGKSPGNSPLTVTISWTFFFFFFFL